jgi:hypothetical protein
MSLEPSTSFRRAGFALATIAGLAFGDAAFAQTAPRPTPINAPPSQPISAGQCAAFGKYVLDEDDAFPGKLSGTFLESISRFVSADCATRDAKGEIQIITMNNQDAASLRTSLMLMGKFDIIGATGVRGCHRPAGGTCPSTTSSTNIPRTGG